MAFNEDNDLWEDDDDDDTHSGKGNKFSDLDREWQVRHNHFHTLGYRDGLLAGKELSVQEGFNNGFKESILAGWNWGVVRGITSAFVFLPEHLKEQLVETSEVRAKFQALYGKVHSISTKDALKLFHENVLKNKEGHSEKIAQVNLEGDLQTLEREDNREASCNSITKGELGDLQRQVDSLLESVPFNPASQTM